MCADVFFFVSEYDLQPLVEMFLCFYPSSNLRKNTCLPRGLVVIFFQHVGPSKAAGIFVRHGVAPSCQVWLAVAKVWSSKSDRRIIAEKIEGFHRSGQNVADGGKCPGYFQGSPGPRLVKYHSIWPEFICFVKHPNWLGYSFWEYPCCRVFRKHLWSCCNCGEIEVHHQA